MSEYREINLPENMSLPLISPSELSSLFNKVSSGNMQSNESCKTESELGEPMTALEREILFDRSRGSLNAIL